MKYYTIGRHGHGGKVSVTVVEGDTTGKAVNVYNLTPVESQKARNHSPDGFEFGYGGSGPAQLALAILMDYTGQKPDEWTVPWKYQDFKFKFIAPMGGDWGQISSSQIDQWLAQEQNAKT